MYARAKRKRLDAEERLEALREDPMMMLKDCNKSEDAVLVPASEEPAPTQTKRKTRVARKRAIPRRTSKRSEANASNKS